MKKELIKITIFVSAVCFFVCSCSHNDDDIKTSSVIETIIAHYNEVTLDWDNNTFTHNGYVVEIPEKWGWEIKGVRSKFKDYNPHDIEFSYNIVSNITYGGSAFEAPSFKELKYIKPSEKNKLFEISTVGLDIDSKLLVKDELLNDYYFKYDSNPDFYNFCYFKIAKNDVNQLKEGYFNQINVQLKYEEHIDSALSFITEIKDGLNDIGIYDQVSISHNPDLI